MDALRAIAAVSVFLSHFNGWVKLPSAINFLEPVMVRLGNGVLIFFVISGFLIYRPFVRANLAGGRRPLLGLYGKRRFLRIVPAYVLALTVTGALVGKPEVFGKNGLLFYGFAQIYSPENAQGGLSVAWSLCVEATLYAFLPIWAYLVAQIPVRNAADRSRREVLALLLLLVVGIVLRFVLAGSTNHTLSLSLIAYLDVFAVGMLLAWWSVRLETRPLPIWLGWLNRYPGISWGLAALCLAVLAWGTGANVSAYEAATSAQIWNRHLLAVAIGVLLMLPLIVGDQSKGILRRVLGFPPFLWLGIVSYGVYLFHPVVLHTLSHIGLVRFGMGSPGGYFAILSLEFLMVVVAASISWHFVERPMNALKSVPLLSPDRRPLPNGSRLALAIAGLLLAFAGISGSGYLIIDVVFIASSLLFLTSMMIPPGRPRPGPGLLLSAAIVAIGFAVVPGILKISTAGDAQVSRDGSSSRIFVAGTAGEGKLRLYVNGSLVGEAPGPLNALASKGPVEIGAIAGASRWIGVVDALSIYNRPITATDVQQQFETGMGGGAGDLELFARSVPGLVRWYSLGDIAFGARDSISGVRSKVIGKVSQSTENIAPNDLDRGSAQFQGFGVIKTPPLTNFRPSSMSVGAWVRTGNSVANRAIIGTFGSWSLRTDLLGHWFFGANGDGRRYGVSGKVAAPRFMPRLSVQTTKTIAASNVSLLAIIGLLLAIGGAAFGLERTQQALRTQSNGRPPGSAVATGADENE